MHSLHSDPVKAKPDMYQAEVFGFGGIERGVYDFSYLKPPGLSFSHCLEPGFGYRLALSLARAAHS